MPLNEDAQARESVELETSTVIAIFARIGQGGDAWHQVNETL
jgi:hypothetical protein